MENAKNWVPVKLPNGAHIKIEITPDAGSRESDVAGISAIDKDAWSEVTYAVEGVAEWAWNTLQKVHPSKASLEFGIEIGLEPGKLTALLVKGTGKANLKVTLEWTEIKD